MQVNTNFVKLKDNKNKTKEQKHHRFENYTPTVQKQLERRLKKYNFLKIY